jgi:hypothetical protein
MAAKEVFVTRGHFPFFWDFSARACHYVQIPEQYNSRHYCLVSLMWMKIGSNDISAQVPGVS